MWLTESLFFEYVSFAIMHLGVSYTSPLDPVVRRSTKLLLQLTLAGNIQQYVNHPVFRDVQAPTLPWESTGGTCVSDSSDRAQQF